MARSGGMLRALQADRWCSELERGDGPRPLPPTGRGPLPVWLIRLRGETTRFDPISFF